MKKVITISLYQENNKDKWSVELDLDINQQQLMQLLETVAFIGNQILDRHEAKENNSIKLKKPILKHYNRA